MKPSNFNYAVITGGSSGIGLAIADQLSALGISIVLIARKEEKLARARKLVESSALAGTVIRTMVLDVADREAVDLKINRLMEETGVPDLLINSAGATYPAAFTDIPPDIYQGIIDVNLTGTWNVISTLVPAMKQVGRGTIVNVSSLGGIVGTYGYSAYAASKFAVIGLSQALRNELRPDGIDVRVLCPPDTDTPMLADENRIKPAETRKISEGGGLLSAEFVAAETIRGLSRRRFLILPGYRSRLTVLVYRLFPVLVHQLIDRNVRMVRRAG